MAIYFWTGCWCHLQFLSLMSLKFFNLKFSRNMIAPNLKTIVVNLDVLSYRRSGSSELIHLRARVGGRGVGATSYVLPRTKIFSRLREQQPVSFCLCSSGLSRFVLFAFFAGMTWRLTNIMHFNDVYRVSPEILWLQLLESWEMQNGIKLIWYILYRHPY